MELTIAKAELFQVSCFNALVRQVRAGMAHPEWFYLDPEDAVREMAEQGKMTIWIAWDGDRAAGVFSILRPGLGRENYGHDLGFSREELERVICMDTAAVHPDYRGRGLQKRMMARAMEELAGAGETILLCTIHPENVYSLGNAQALGFTIQKTLEKYGSVRAILRKDIPEKKKEEI